MSEENHGAEMLKAAFGDKSIYEIFEVEKDAPIEVITKAYRKLALKHHPDKGGNASTFQALSLAHSIISDPEKRKVYDQTGDVDGEDESQDFRFWYDYFRNMFPTITVGDIESFSKKYIDSEEEQKDIIEAYNKHGGNIGRIMEEVMFAEDGEELRIIKAVEKAISEKKLKSTTAFASGKRHYESKAKSTKPSTTKKQKDDDVASLQAMILIKNSNSYASAMGNIFEKYTAPKGKTGKDKSEKRKNSHDDITDEEFLKIQAGLKKSKK